MVSLGMLFDVPKAKNTVLAARIFLRISTVSQHPACLDHVIQTRKSIRYFFKLCVYFGKWPGWNRTNRVGG